MSKELDIVLEKVYGHTDLSQIVREDTYTSLGKINEVETDFTKAFPKQPGFLSKVGSNLGPIGKAASASYALGQLATGTETGRKWGRDFAKAHPTISKAAGDFVNWRDKTLLPKTPLPKLGITSLSTAAKTPYVGKAADSAASAAKDVADVATGSYKSTRPSLNAQPGSSVGDNISDLARIGSEYASKKGEGDKQSNTKPAETPATTAPTTAPTTAQTPAPKEPAKEPAKAPESKTSMSFKQAFAKARKEAGGGKGQFEYGGKKYQTNINPAKGAEKYISATKQKATSVKVPKADTSAPKDDTPKDNKPEAPKVEPLRNLRQQPPPTAQNMPKTKEDQEKSNAQGNDTYQKTRDNLDSPEASKERHDKEKGREDAANKVLEPLRKGLDAVEKLPGGDTIKKFTGDVKTNPSTQNESVQVGNYKYRIV